MRTRGEGGSYHDQNTHFVRIENAKYLNHRGGGWGGGVNTNAYKCVRGGRGGLIMTKIRILYALKMLNT